MDSELSLRFSVRHTMGYVDRPLYRYRRHSHNVSGAEARDAAQLLRILRRFRDEETEYVQQHRRLVDRGVAKFAGRAAVLRLAADPDYPRDEALSLLGEAVRLEPLKLKHARRYLTVALLGPKLYRRLRRRGGRPLDPAG